MPPNKPEVETPVPNESSMTNDCRFTQSVLSMPPMEGFDADFDLGVKHVDGNLSDGPQQRFVLYKDNALWHQVMKMKDPQPELLRWYLYLKKFVFVVQDKVNVHTLLDLHQVM